MSRFIPLSIPNFEGNERKYVDDAIDQGWVSTGGAYISKLEQMMAEYLHVDNVAACQSGTAAQRNKEGDLYRFTQPDGIPG